MKSKQQITGWVLINCVVFSKLAVTLIFDFDFFCSCTVIVKGDNFGAELAVDPRD